MKLRLLLVLAFAVAAGLTALTNVSVGSSSGAQLTRTRTVSAFARAHGLVYDGLRRVRGGPCGALYQLDLPGPARCTHGPDPSPAGIDVRTRRTLAQLRATLRPSRRFKASADPPPVPCIGDGTSGDRVQVIYAHPPFTDDRYKQVAPLIREWAAQVEATYERSAAETGGSRQIRFVTNAQCQVSVRDAIARSNTMPHTILDLKIQGYSSENRKYLIWMDANEICGLGESYSDDRPTTANLNDGPKGTPGMFARIDEACWGLYDLRGSVEAHELTHTLGAVLRNAPHATKYGHCTDRYDVMCYVDGPGTVLHDACPPSHQQLLDCHHDDYFSTAPGKGSWLASHWNTANNSFLVGGVAPAAPPPPPPPPPPSALKCVVPNVANAPLTGALLDILRAHCTLKTSTRVYSRSVKKNRVISQAPAAGTVLPLGGKVSIVISEGPPPSPTSVHCIVPGVKGLTMAKAVTRLTHAGCTIHIKQKYSKRVRVGRVISQAPKRGKVLALRASVTIVLSRGPKPGQRHR